MLSGNTQAGLSANLQAWKSLCRPGWIWTLWDQLELKVCSTSPFLSCYSTMTVTNSRATPLLSSLHPSQLGFQECDPQPFRGRDTYPSPMSIWCSGIFLVPCCTLFSLQCFKVTTSACFLTTKDAFFLIIFFFFFQTVALALLGLTLKTRLSKTHRDLPASAGIKGMCHHLPA